MGRHTVSCFLVACSCAMLMLLQQGLTSASGYWDQLVSIRRELGSGYAEVSALLPSISIQWPGILSRVFDSQ